MENIKIAFYHLESKKNRTGESPVYVRIIYKGESINLSTNIFLKPSDWDKKKFRIKGKHSRSQSLNGQLAEQEKRIYSIFDNLKYKGEQISTTIIKRELRNKSVKKDTLISLYDSFLSNIEQRVNHTYSVGTYNHYRSSKEKVITFLQTIYHANDIDIERLNYEFVTRLEAFLLNHFKNKVNTANKEIKRLKAVVNSAIRLGWVNKNPFENYKGKTEPTNRQYLTQDEIDNIEKLDLAHNIRHSIIRDIFLFMTYTGLSYSDMAKLSERDITMGINNKSFIQLRRQKTNEVSTIPLFEKAANIIAKYRSNLVCLNTGTLLPLVSNTKINEALKTIGIISEVTKPLTCHIARHTFATISLENRVPLETVSKVLGHNNIRTTQIYAKVTKTKIDKDFSVLENLFSSKLVKDDNQIKEVI